MELTPLDWIMLRAAEVKAVLAGVGLHNARVVGWAGANMQAVAGVHAEIQVDLPPTTDLTSGDMKRIDDQLSELVGLPVVVWATRPGEAEVLPGEKIRYL